jgi:competence protein ComEC
MEMLRTGIVILTGMVLACYSPQLIDNLWISFLPIVLLISVRQPKFATIGFLISGFLWASLAMNWQLNHRLPQSLNNKRLVMLGEVINIPQSSPRSTKFLIRPLSFSPALDRLPQRIKLNWRDAPPSLRPGQRWRLLVKLKQPHGYQNPGGFDYERWLFGKGIQATGLVVGSDQNELLRQPAFNLNGWRMDINDQIEKHCHGCRQSGLMQALATGFRGNIPQPTRQLLQQTGTAHLIAVSGLHIGIIASVFYFIGLRLWRQLRWLQSLVRTDFSIGLAWCGGLIYSLLSGFDLPAQRAMMMLSVLLFTSLLRLPLNLLHSTIAAVLLVLIVSPLAVLSSSFWLTLNALLIIIFASQLLRRQDSWLKQLVIIQGLFALLYIPISLIIFNQLHTASFFANLFAVPWVSLLIVPFNFLLLLLFWLPDDFLQLLYGLLDLMLQGLVDFLSWLPAHGLSAIKLPPFSVHWLILSVIGLLILLQPGRLISRNLLWMALPLSIFWRPQQPPDLRVSILDVGMGTSVVLQTRQHSLIYDFGPGNRSRYSLGKWVVLPFLQQAGIEQVDSIVLSHSDQDHIGGLYAVSEKFADTPVFSGMVEDIRNKFPQFYHLQSCQRAPSWRWDGVLFEFLQTAHEPSDSDNDRSCVLRISSARQVVLLSGDIEQLQEQRLLQKYRQKLKADYLVVPHHGSMTSSSVAFIKAVSARQVIFTSGFLNRWRFPRAEIIDRYRKSGAQIHNTAEAGAIEIVCDKTACRLNEYRRRRPRIWY